MPLYRSNPAWPSPAISDSASAVASRLSSVEPVFPKSVDEDVPSEACAAPQPTGIHSRCRQLVPKKPLRRQLWREAVSTACQRSRSGAISVPPRLRHQRNQRSTLVVRPKHDEGSSSKDRKSVV